MAKLDPTRTITDQELETMHRQDILDAIGKVLQKKLYKGDPLKVMVDLDGTGEHVLCSDYTSMANPEDCKTREEALRQSLDKRYPPYEFKPNYLRDEDDDDDEDEVVPAATFIPDIDYDGPIEVMKLMPSDVKPQQPVVNISNVQNLFIYARQAKSGCHCHD